MQNGTIPVRLIANELRHKFLARYMATHSKNHQKTIRRKKPRPAVARRRAQPAAAPKPPVLQRPRLVINDLVKESPAPNEIDLGKDDEEPKAEDLAKEEPIK